MQCDMTEGKKTGIFNGQKHERIASEWKYNRKKEFNIEGSKDRGNN